MNPDWPATLPQYPLRQGFSVEPVDNVARAPTDSGPGKQRPRSRREFLRVRCQVKVADENELATLLAFHRETLIQGALRFTWAGITDNLHNGDYEALQFTRKPDWRRAGARAWLVSLDLVAIPAAPPVGLVDTEWMSAFVTLTRPETLDYYDAEGNPQNAPIDQPAFDYFPSTLAYRGLKLGSTDTVAIATDFIAAGVGAITVGTEPMATSAHNVFTIDDGSSNNRIQLDVDGAGEYVFTVRAGGVEVASLATGVFAELLVRKTFLLTWADNAFRALGSGGAVVADAAGDAPTGLAAFSVGPDQWIQPLAYEPRGYAAAQMSVAGEVSFGTGVLVSDVSVSEAAGTITFTIERVGDKSGASSVDYATADATATAGADYTAAAGTANFAAGETQKQVQVTISPDATYEGDETLALNLSNPVGCTILDATAIGTILNDDAPPVVGVQATAYNFDEDSGNAVVTLEKIGASDVDASVDYQTQAGTAVDGVDYVGVADTATIPAGQTTTQIQVPLIDRTGLQGDRAFDVVLSNPVDCTLGSTTATVTIQDPPEISVDDPVATEGTDPNLVFTLTRAGRSNGTCSVQVDTQDGTATAGQDYTAVTGLVVNFGDGETQKTVQVPVINDDAYENNQTLTLQLSVPVGCEIVDPSGTGTITSEDAAPVVSVDQTSYAYDEDVGLATVTLIKTGNTEEACSVDWNLNDGTAVAGTDYTDDNGTANFAAGETQKQVQVSIIDRTGGQGQRTFDLVLSNPSNCTIGDDTATVTIDDVFHLSDAVAAYDLQDAGSLWQDTAGTTAAGVGDPLGRIDDQSGNGNHLLQGTTAAKPTLQNDGANNYAYLDGVDDVMSASVSVGHPLTVAAAIESIAGIFEFGQQGADGNEYFILAANGNLGHRGSGGAFNVTTTLSGIEIRRGRAPATDFMEYFLDGVSQGTNSGDVVTDPFSGGVILGGRAFGGSLSPAECNFYRGVVMDRDLTSGEAASLDQWLADGSGVSL